MDASARIIAEEEEIARQAKYGSPVTDLKATTSTVSTPTPKVIPVKAAKGPEVVTPNSINSNIKVFSPKEQVQLIKAVKAIPGGVSERWSKIADYVNLHGGEGIETIKSREGKWSGDECVKMSKNIDKASVEKFVQSQSQKHDFVIADALTQRDQVNTDVKIGATKKVRWTSSS